MYNSLISPAKIPGQEEESKKSLALAAKRVSEVVEFPSNDEEIDENELFSNLAIPDDNTDTELKRESFGRLTEKLNENTKVTDVNVSKENKSLRIARNKMEEQVKEWKANE